MGILGAILMTVLMMGFTLLVGTICFLGSLMMMRCALDELRKIKHDRKGAKKL